MFVKEMGEELDEPVVPAPIDIDPGHVAMMCNAHGMDVLGPPPSPRCPPIGATRASCDVSDTMATMAG